MVLHLDERKEMDEPIARPESLTGVRCMDLVLQHIPIIGHLMSCVYAIKGHRREAQTSACRATFGLIGYPLEILNNKYRHKSLKLVSPNFNDLDSQQVFLNSEWMARYPNHRINRLWIPGSHNSGTHTIEDGIINCWSICQEYDIYTQLMIGVRYLDFRVITVEDTVYIAHRFKGAPFTRCLDKIHRFLQRHPTEVVLVRIDHNCSGGQCDVSAVREVVNEYLGECMVKRNECVSLRNGKIPTIAELTQELHVGRVLLLSTGIDFSSLNVHQFSYKTSWMEYHCQYPLQWYSNYTDFISTYQMKRKYMERDFVLMAGELTPEKDVAVQSVVGQITRGIGQCIGALWVEEQFEDLKDQCCAANHQLHRFLKDSRQSLMNKRPVVISHDFLNPEIVELILNLNTKKL